MDPEGEYVAFPDAKGRKQSARRIGPVAAPSSRLAMIGAAAVLGFGLTLGGLLRGRHAAAPPAPAAAVQAPVPMPAPAIVESPAPASSGLDLIKGANPAQGEGPNTAVAAADLSGADPTNLAAPPQAGQAAGAQSHLAGNPHLGRSAFSSGASLWERIPAQTPAAAQAVSAVQGLPQTSPQPAAQRAPAPAPAPAWAPSERYLKMVDKTKRMSMKVAQIVAEKAGSMGSLFTPNTAPATLKGFSLNTLGSGPVSLDSWASPRNLVVYMVPWCSPCRQDARLVNHLRDALAGRGISTRIIVGVDKEREVEAFASEFGPGTLLDPKNTVPVNGYPMYMITDQHGNVLRSHPGSFENEADGLLWAQSP